MNITKKSIPVYAKKLPIIDYKEILVYVALDGREFTVEAECKAYEERIEHDRLWKEVETLSIPEEIVIEGFPTEYYYSATQDQLNRILTHVGFHEDEGHSLCIVYLNDKRKKDLSVREMPDEIIRQGNWVGYQKHDGGDYPDTYYIYSLQYVKAILLTHITQLSAVEKLHVIEKES